jgi:hypothetical protein
LLEDDDRERRRQEATSTTSTTTGCTTAARTALAAAAALLARLLTPADDLPTLDALPFVQDALPPAIARERHAVAARVARAAQRAEAARHLDGERRCEAAWRRCSAQLQLLGALGGACRVLMDNWQEGGSDDKDALAELRWMAAATTTAEELGALLEAARAALAEVGPHEARRGGAGGGVNGASPSYSDEEEEDRALSLLAPPLPPGISDGAGGQGLPPRLPSDLCEASSSWVRRHAGGGLDPQQQHKHRPVLPRSVAGLLHSRAARAKAAALAAELAAVDRRALAWALLPPALDGARLKSLAVAWGSRVSGQEQQQHHSGDVEAPQPPPSTLLECVAKAALVAGVRPADAAPVALCVAPDGGDRSREGALEQEDTRALLALRRASAAQVAGLAAAGGAAATATAPPTSVSFLPLDAVAEDEREDGGGGDGNGAAARRGGGGQAQARAAPAVKRRQAAIGRENDLEAGVRD